MPGNACKLSSSEGLNSWSDISYRHYKCWKVSGVFPWAATLFVVGYVLREVGAFNHDNLPIYISSIVFIYAAPPLYELANYFVLSRILYYIPYHSPIHPGRVFTTFAAMSSVVEALTANGAANVANSSLSEKRQETGRSLLKAALCLQLAILASFVLLAATFHRRCNKANLMPKNLKAALITLYISSALIGIRTIYRTVEYFTTAHLNFAGITDVTQITPIFRYEWFFWVFEASLMMINTWLINARHPMRYLPRNNKIYLSEDGVTEIEGEGYQDRRNFFVTLIDPFDLWGAYRGRNMERRFWENSGEGRVVGVAGDGSYKKTPFPLINLYRKQKAKKQMQTSNVVTKENADVENGKVDVAN
jgi:hypothetical protein